MNPIDRTTQGNRARPNLSVAIGLASAIYLALLAAQGARLGGPGWAVALFAVAPAAVGALSTQGVSPAAAGSAFCSGARAGGWPVFIYALLGVAVQYVRSADVANNPGVEILSGLAAVAAFTAVAALCGGAGALVSCRLWPGGNA